MTNVPVESVWSQNARMGQQLLFFLCVIALKKSSQKQREESIQSALVEKGQLFLKTLEQIFEAAVKVHSWEQYSQIQKADLEAFDKFQKVQHVEVIRLKEEDIAKFRRFAPALWVMWAKKHPLAMKAFKSQWEYMKSVKVGYYTDKDLVDPNGKKLEI